ncbi:hypothetical protein N9399_06485 [Porticoccaceae bacterium]|nr:hypothetical protein [Porticoccaceae bacterium]
MGLFGLFSRKKPDEVYQSIAKKIVLSSLQFRHKLDSRDNKCLADAGAELIYLLLNLLDQTAFSELGASDRDEVFDNVFLIVLDDYVSAIVSVDMPSEFQDAIKEEMIKDMNARQSIYCKCDSFSGSPLPSKGTVIFAFSFYLHKALGNTDITDVDDILIGNREIGDSEFDGFPAYTEVLENMISVTSIYEALKISKELKHLKW